MSFVFSFAVAHEVLVEPLSFHLLRITLSDEVIINDAFLDVSNYTLSVIEGSGEFTIREVLPVQDGSTTTRRILLSVDRPTVGTQYRVTIANLVSPDGSVSGGSADFIARRTKTETILGALPPHFDARPTSTLSQLLTAIGISDDRIGGSRSDTLP